MKLSTLLGTAFMGACAAGAAIEAETGARHVPEATCTVDQHPRVDDLKGVSYLQYVNAAHLRTCGRTYRFVHVPRTCADKPYILFLHGFPESSFDWRHQVEHFGSNGYGVIAPDLLGYGGTDKPDDLNSYRIKLMVEEMIELLDCLNIDVLHAVAHDFGSPLLSRIANFYPSRLLTASFLDIGYDAPPIPYNLSDIEKANQETLQTEGFEALGYWLFFNRDNAGHILNSHLDSLWSIIYTDDESIWKTSFSPPGAAENFLTHDQMAPWGGFVSVEERAIHNRIFDPADKGYITPLNWYKAAVRNLNAQDETTVPANSIHLKMPVLAIGAAKDPVGTPEATRMATEPYAENFSFQVVDSGHFMMLEKADEVNQILEEFFQKNTQSST